MICIKVSVETRIKHERTVFDATVSGQSVTNQFQKGFNTYLDNSDLANRVRLVSGTLKAGTAPIYAFI